MSLNLLCLCCAACQNVANKSCDVHSIFTFNQPNVFIIFHKKQNEKCCENKCSQSEKRVDKEKKNPIFSRRHEQRSINLWNRFGFSQWIFAKHFGKSIAISASAMIEVEALTISNSCQFMKKFQIPLRYFCGARFYRDL